jgi:hypothetical protein
MNLGTELLYKVCFRGLHNGKYLQGGYQPISSGGKKMRRRKEKGGKCKRKRKTGGKRKRDNEK